MMLGEMGSIAKPLFYFWSWGRGVPIRNDKRNPDVFK